MIEFSPLLGGGVEIENLESDATCRLKVETVRHRALVVLSGRGLTCGYNLEVF
jgi:hypothetical protein